MTLLYLGQTRLPPGAADAVTPLEFSLCLMGDQIPNRGMVHHLQDQIDRCSGELVVSWIREE